MHKNKNPLLQTNNVQALMRQEVTRKEFLQYIGIVLLGIIGVSSVMSSLRQHTGSSLVGPGGKKEAVGYGMSAYGR